MTRPEPAISLDYPCTTIAINSRWPTRLHQVFTQKEPLMVCGLEFYTESLELGIDGSRVLLRRLIRRAGPWYRSGTRSDTASRPPPSA